MEKDLKELLNNLKELRETIEKIGNSEFKDMKDKLINRLENSLNEPCKILIEKDKTGKAKVTLDGERLALLITFIGLKNQVLKQLKCGKEELEFLENFVGSEEVK